MLGEPGAVCLCCGYTFTRRALQELGVGIRGSKLPAMSHAGALSRERLDSRESQNTVFHVTWAHLVVPAPVIDKEMVPGIGMLPSVPVALREAEVEGRVLTSALWTLVADFLPL